MGKPKASSDRIAKILNRALLGGGQHKIAEDTEENTKLVWNVMKAYPLWDYCRKKDCEDV